MKMRPGTQAGFLLCGKEWIEGDTLEVHSPWDRGLVGRVTIATRADARQAVNHAAAALRRTRALPRWKCIRMMNSATLQGRARASSGPMPSAWNIWFWTSRR